MAFVRSRGCFIASVCFIAIGWFSLAMQPEVDEVSTLATSHADSVKTQPSLPAQTNHSYSDQPSISAELDGMTMPYQLTVDEAGDLVVTSDLKEFFEYYLAAHDIRDFEQKQALVRSKLVAALPSPAREQALAIFDQYIALKKALSQQAEYAFSTDSLHELLQAKTQLIQSYLGIETYSVFYAEEHRYLAYLIDVQQGQVAAKDANEDHHRAFLQAPHIRLQALTNKAGATQSEKLHAVQQHYGVAAAQRYEQVLSKRNVFNERLAQFDHQRQNILAAEGITAESQRLQIEQLLSEQFDAREQLRVQARIPSLLQH